MEIGKGGGGGGGGGGEGGEFRRVNVVYFLSRGGNVEHPHLIRVHHLHRAGVRLRDVKRWLSELRGKDMPDSFAWSYKRRYRSGYVWQDLTDDDLITPISDNEFVLKGSELPHRPLHPSSTINELQPRPFPPLISEKSSRPTTAAAAEEEKEKEKEKEKEAAKEAAEATTATAAERPKPNSSLAEKLRIVLEEDDEVLSPNLPPPPRDSSDESGAQRRRSAVFKIDACEAAEQATGQQQQQQQQQQEEELQEREDRMAGESPSRSRSRSLRRASHVLRNILTCRVVEINDAALLPVSRPERSSCDGGGGGSQLAARRRTNLEGRHYDSRKSRSGGGKGTKMAGEKVAGVASAAAYKPFGAPYCSQCGKRFNPEKLHSHMKSCKALKARGNGYTNLQKGEYSRQVK